MSHLSLNIPFRSSHRHRQMFLFVTCLQKKQMFLLLFFKHVCRRMQKKTSQLINGMHCHSVRICTPHTQTQTQTHKAMRYIFGRHFSKQNISIRTKTSQNTCYGCVCTVCVFTFTYTCIYVPHGTKLKTNMIILWHGKCNVLFLFLSFFFFCPMQFSTVFHVQSQQCQHKTHKHNLLPNIR